MNSILLFGGSSDERLVSVASAQNLAQTYSFTELWYWHKEGEISQVGLAELSQHQDAYQKEFKPAQAFKKYANLEAGLEKLQNHVVFLGLHGTQGEDGELQKFFEKNKVQFTASGSVASHRCFDKEMAKKIVVPAGLRVAKGQRLLFSEKSSWPEQIRTFAASSPRFVLKPAANGSSFGLQIVRKPDQLESAILQVSKNNFGDYLLEEFIEGRELTVGVYQKQNELLVLPASEVIMNQGFEFDYQGKYLGVGSKEVTPAQISDEEMNEAQLAAKKAHEALGCFGYSRTDLVLTKSGVVFIETNTLPGMTRASFYPQQLTALDLKLKEFIQDQLNLAQKR